MRERKSEKTLKLTSFFVFDYCNKKTISCVAVLKDCHNRGPLEAEDTIMPCEDTLLPV